jgi:hypothetical protein
LKPLSVIIVAFILQVPANRIEIGHDPIDASSKVGRVVIVGVDRTVVVGQSEEIGRVGRFVRVRRDGHEENEEESRECEVFG